MEIERETSTWRAAAVLSGIGTAQLIAWGSLYYAIAVLSEPIRRELGVSQTAIFAAFAISVALSGLLAPWAGRLVDRHGGRIVLSVGTSIGALSFSLLASSRAAWICLLVAAPAGVAMAMSFYDTCFAALWQQYPSSYRRSVTFVTLVAGLASTVFWPATHFLLCVLSWRSTCWVFALLLVVATAINWLTFSHARRISRPLISDAGERGQSRSSVGRARGLVSAFAGVSFVSASLSAHLPATLHAMRFEPEISIWISSSVGVMQVVGRALEFSAGGGLPARKLGLITFVAVLAALILLLASTGIPALALAFAMLYGAANGVLTVVGAILPRELFGTAELGAVLGRFAAPSRVARALAPWAVSVAAATVGSWEAMLCVAGIAALSLATYVLTVPLTQVDSRP